MLPLLRQNPHPHEARTHLHTPSFRWAVEHIHLTSVLPATSSRCSYSPPHRTIALSARLSTPPTCSNLHRSSPCYTIASAHRHIQYDTHTDTPARSAHLASIPEHHRYRTRTHTPPAHRQTRNPALSSSTDLPRRTQTHAHNCSAHYLTNTPKCPSASIQIYAPHVGCEIHFKFLSEPIVNNRPSSRVYDEDDTVMER